MSAVLLLLLAPLFTGCLKWVKARLQNRQGPGPLIDYFNLLKLAQKSYIVPETASAVFLLGPSLSFLGAVLAATMLPVFPGLSFTGDFLLVLYLLNLGRFFQALAALDSGSAFGGQGSYRESLVAVLTEPGTILALSAVALSSQELSLASLAPLSAQNLLVYALALAALLLSLVAEGARMPVDDPATHLELTMIHEAQLLDHSGPLLALYELASGVKMLSYLALASLLLPLSHVLAFLLMVVLGFAGLAIIETYGVRLRYLRLPDLLTYNTLAGILAMLGVVLRFRI